MAIITNQIGSHAFIDLAGNPQAVRNAIALLTRAGVDGVTLVNEAERGTPFVLRSKVDCESFQSCWDTYRAYLATIATDPVELTWQDVALSTNSLKVMVLDVHLQVAKRLAVASSGGLNPPSLGWLECDWTLVAVDVSDPPAP